MATLLNEAAMAAQNAAELRPDDTPLAEAAAQLVTRGQQISAEAAALTPMIDEKTAAVKPLAEAQEAAKAPIGAAVAKLAPLKAAFLQAEQVMLESRRRSAEQSQRLAAVDERLKTVEQFTQLSAQQQAFIAATGAARDQEQTYVALQQQVSEYVPVVAAAQTGLTTATDAMTAATNGMNIATTEHSRRNQFADLLASAVVSAEAALQQVNDDATLAGAVTKLKQRSAAAHASLAESQAAIDAASTAMSAATAAMTMAQQVMADTTAELARRQQAMTDGNAALDAAKAELAARETDFNARQVEVEDRLVHNFSTSSLKPLTPEQLCWSVFKVTGVYDRYWQAEVAELEKNSPLTEEQKQDATFMAARNIELEQKTYDKLKGNIGTFVAFYGAAAGQPQGDFFSTADQALFAANGGSINSWVAPAADNVTDRVIKQTDPRIAAEEIYLSLLTRLPTEEEVADVTTYLASRTADRNVAAQELAWAVLNSAEFRFNH
ncbi:MAG: hypothetical protein R3C49_12915 [Planctomycetaceae bacterium]